MKEQNKDAVESMSLIMEYKKNVLAGRGYDRSGVRIITEVWRRGVKYCDVRYCGVMDFISVVVVVCKIISEDSNGTSKHEEWCKCCRCSVYMDRLLGIGGFPDLLSLLILLYSKAINDFGIYLHTCPCLDLETVNAPAPSKWLYVLPRTLFTFRLSLLRTRTLLDTYLR